MLRNEKRLVLGWLTCFGLALLVLVLLMATAGCAGPQYARARPKCLGYAVDCVVTAILEDGRYAGMYQYIPAGAHKAHQVVWVMEGRRERVWDPLNRRWVRFSDGDTILFRGTGLDLGWWGKMVNDMCESQK